MKPNAAVALSLAVIAFAAGCELGDTALNSDVAGRVLDSNSQPVRGATVRTRDGSTTTTETGAYYLSGNREGELEIIAEITQNGTNYRGRTFAFSIDGSLRNSQNIIVAPVSQLGTIRGRVRDRSGFALANASVWAYSGAGSAQRAFTNSAGDYELRDLVGGFSYEVRAGGRGFLSDNSTAVVPVGGSVVRDLTLDTASVSGLPRPTGLTGTAWTSHFQATRSERSPRAWASWHLDGRRELPKAEPKGRATEPLVEVELSWDEIRSRDHQGWGIYRGAGDAGSVSSYEFSSDGLSAYYFDGNAQPNQIYSYAVSTLSSWYPDVAGTTESGLSDRLVAETLGLLQARPALGAGTGSGPTLPWTLVPTVEQYVVYLFDQQPGVGVSSIWNTEGTTVTASSVTVPNIGLVRGRTYYWLVLGLANGTDSRTISQVQSFIF